MLQQGNIIGSNGNRNDDEVEIVKVFKEGGQVVQVVEVRPYNSNGYETKPAIVPYHQISG